MISCQWPRRLGRVGLLLLTLGLPLASEARAPRQPVQLTGTYTDHDLDRQARESTPNCAVSFQIEDARRSPELAGVVWERAVLTPPDTKSWLQAVLAALTARGIAPQFETDAEQAPGVPTAKLSLQMASVTNTIDIYTAIVVVKVHARGTDTVLDRTYRGRGSQAQWLSAPTPTMQRAMDRALGQILNALGKDLVGMCPAQSQDQSPSTPR